MRFEDTNEPVRGEIHLKVYRCGEVIDEVDDHNLVVESGRRRLAQLAAGAVENYSQSYITHIGVGSGSAAENIDDTNLENQQLFPLTSTEVNDRDVKCSFYIANDEAVGLAIREFGLFCPDGTMFSHRVRQGVIEKLEDIEIRGYWILHFKEGEDKWKALLI